MLQVTFKAMDLKGIQTLLDLTHSNFCGPENISQKESEMSL